MSSACLPFSSLTRPERCSTVTPGKLATFCRSPVSRLNRVDFPELGGPMIAITAPGAALVGLGAVRTAGPHPWQSLMPVPVGAISHGMRFPAAARTPIHPRDTRADLLPAPKERPQLQLRAENPAPSNAGLDRPASPDYPRSHARLRRVRK